MPITISALTADDRHDWQPLWEGYLRFYEHSLSAAVTTAMYTRILDDSFAMYGAIARDDTGKPLGIVHWLTHPSTWSVEPYCYLEDLFVAPDARTGGVGSALIQHVRQWCEERALPKLYWQTAVGNTTARRLYDRVATTEFVVYEIDLVEES